VNDLKRAPTSLRVVAALFFLAGVLGAINSVAALLHDSLHIRLEVLGLFIAPGLLKCRRGWRTCALVLLWIGFLVTTVMTGIVLYGGLQGPWELGWNWGSPHRTVISPFVFLGPIAAGSALLVWQYRVLTRPGIRELFLSATPPDTPRKVDEGASAADAGVTKVESGRNPVARATFYVMLTLLGCGIWALQHHVDFSIESVANIDERATYSFTLHWDAEPQDREFVRLTANPPDWSRRSSFGRKTIEGERFNGAHFDKEDARNRAAQDERECEIYVRRSGERTIQIKLKNAVPVEIRSDDEAHSRLSVPGGAEIAWGAVIGPGEHELLATRVEP
jgi:hypothetical protein